MGRSQLLHHHVEVAIQRPERRVIIRARQSGDGIFLFSASSLGSAGSPVWFLAGEIDDQRFGGRRGSVGGREGIINRFISTNVFVVKRRGGFLCARRTRAATFLGASGLDGLVIELHGVIRLDRGPRFIDDRDCLRRSGQRARSGFVT